MLQRRDELQGLVLHWALTGTLQSFVSGYDTAGGHRRGEKQPFIIITRKAQAEGDTLTLNLSFRQSCINHWQVNYIRGINASALVYFCCQTWFAPSDRKLPSGSFLTYKHIRSMLRERKAECLFKPVKLADDTDFVFIMFVDMLLYPEVTVTHFFLFNLSCNYFGVGYGKHGTQS